MEVQSLKNKTIKGVVWKTFNTVCSVGVSFVVGIILARILMPSDYGALAMIGVFTSVLGLFSDGGLTVALIRKENRTEVDRCTIFYYNFIANYIIYGIIYVMAPFIADFYAMPILCKLARISSISLLISPFASMQSLVFTINLDFKTPAYIGLFCNIFNAIIAILMAYSGYGVWALAVPGIFTCILRVVITISIVRWYPTKRFSWNSFKELFAFSSNILVSMIFSKIYNNITPLVVGKFFSSTQLGLYEKANGWPSLPSQTLTEVLQGVTFPVMSKMQNDISRLCLNYRRMLKFYAFIMFPFMFGLAAVAKPLTIVLVTDKWIDSVPLMQLICFSMMWYPVHALSNNVINATGHSDYFLNLSIITGFCSLLLMACSLPFGLIVFCVVNIFTSILCLYMTSYYIKRILGIGFVDILKDIIPVICNCFFMGVICIVIQLIFYDNVLQLVISIPIAIVYYIISSMVFNKEQFNEAIDILSPKFSFLKKYRVK